MDTQLEASVADLYLVTENSKAELVNGEIVLMKPTGGRPGRAGGAIYVSLREYERRTDSGYAFPDNVGFIVNLPHRRSFSPDVAYHTGGEVDMRFLEGAPVFAAEIRSENDYGPAAEQAMAAKRMDYFAAGTLVVWDVDLLGPDTVRVYRASDPLTPTVYRRNDQAEAEPALPGWTMPVEELFS